MQKDVVLSLVLRGLTITDESVPSRNREVIERFGEDELLLFHSAVGTLFEVNKVGREIWRMCDGSLAVAQIKTSIASRFTPSERVDEDTEGFLNRLFGLNLIHVT